MNELSLDEQNKLIDEKIKQVCDCLSTAESVTMIANWRVGYALIPVYEAKASYGASAMRKIAEGVTQLSGRNITESSLYDYLTIARNVNETELRILAEKAGVSYSKILSAVRRIPHADKRVEFLTETAELPYSEFNEQLQETFPVEEAKEGWAAKNEEDTPVGGTRTGTGHGKSPISAPKRAIKTGEKFRDALDDTFLALKEADFETDKQSENFDAALEELVELMSQLVELTDTVKSEIENYHSKGVEDKHVKQEEQVSPITQLFETAKTPGEALKAIREKAAAMSASRKRK